MTFENAWMLFVGGPLVVFVAWWVFFRRPVAAIRVSDGRAVRRVAPKLTRVFPRVPDLLRVLALTVLVVALGRPQVEDYTVLSGEGADIMIALDMSGSMNAVDRTPAEIAALRDAGREPLNRFDAAREILKAFVKNRREDRVGLIVFGRDVFLKFPLTLDYSVVLGQLDDLVLASWMTGADGACFNDCTISGAGTALGDALARAYRRLRDSVAKTKAIVLITDGKREGGKLAPRTVARYIASQPDDQRVRVYTFLVGSPDKAMLPVYRRALNPQTRQFEAALARDAAGNVIYGASDQPMPTDPALLKEIADLTGGRFFEAYDEEQFREQFQELEKTEFRTETRQRRRDIFFPFVLVGLAFLGLEWLLRLTVLRKFP